MPASLEIPLITIQTLSLQSDKIEPINQHVILHHSQKEVFDNKSLDCFGKGSFSEGSRPKSRLTVGWDFAFAGGLSGSSPSSWKGGIQSSGLQIHGLRSAKYLFGACCTYLKNPRALAIWICAYGYRNICHLSVSFEWFWHLWFEPGKGWNYSWNFFQIQLIPCKRLVPNHWDARRQVRNHTAQGAPAAPAMIRMQWN